MPRPPQKPKRNQKTVMVPMFAHVDFISRRAWVGSQERVFNDQFGGGFDLSALTANGMEILSTNANRPIAADALLSALAGPNIGVAIDWRDMESPAGDNGQVRLLQWSDNADPSQASNLVTLHARYLDDSVFADDWNSLFVSTPTGVLVQGGTNRAVFNMGRPVGASHVSEVFANGSTAQSASLGYAFAGAPLVAIGFELLHAPTLTTAVLGGAVRSLTVFPAA